MKAKFGDLAIGTKIKLGTLIWEKMKPCKTGPWRPQNVVYQHPKIHITHTDYIRDDEEVEVVES